MKLLKLTVALAVSGLFLGAGTAAYAIIAIPPVSQTFVFNSTDPTDLSLDGCTITLGFTFESGGLNEFISGWDLKDPVNGVELKNGDGSYVDYQQVYYYSATTWEGSFDIWGFVPEFGEAVEFSGYNSPGSLADSFHGEPPGTWTAQASVPDVLNSLQLFALALAGLGASHLFFRRQTPVLGRN